MEVDLDFQLHRAHVHWLVYLHFICSRLEKTSAAGKRFNPTESNPSGQIPTMCL